MRSTLIRTGIWSEENGVATLNLHPNDSRMEHLLSTIESFILETREQGRKSFSELCDRLLSPEYHIGLRQGLIPIYLAVVLHEYRQQTVINDRFSAIPASADVLVQINAEPDAFSLEYLDWNPEKENYITQLAEAFRDYVVDAKKLATPTTMSRMPCTVGIWLCLSTLRNAKHLQRAVKSENGIKK